MSGGAAASSSPAKGSGVISKGGTNPLKQGKPVPRPSAVRKTRAPSPVSCLTNTKPPVSTKKTPSKDDAEPKIQRPSFTNSHELVTLLVGKEPDVKRFVLHKESACFYSPVFKAAFNSEFIEGKTQECRMEDVNENAAQFLVRWLYHQELTTLVAPEGKCSQTDFISLIQLWVLADKLLIPRLQNLAIREAAKICSKAGVDPSLEFNWVYANTVPESPLRSLMIDYCVSKMDSIVYTTHPDRFPAAMWMDLTIVLAGTMTSMVRRRHDPENIVLLYLVPEA
ncbi:hypothetical protein LSUE1_G005521 [Lachnellula suecica]|uniref:BTB domain-containing protein n=1 Tax=Lachnellula suecica TaxID=602035 RepID=A0A8T9C739_9HELO|nr:hypothetical protein LSUE1_G005521 [Lachnellula suecica]